MTKRKYPIIEQLCGNCAGNFLGQPHKKFCSKQCYFLSKKTDSFGYSFRICVNDFTKEIYPEIHKCNGKRSWGIADCQFCKMPSILQKVSRFCCNQCFDGYQSTLSWEDVHGDRAEELRQKASERATNKNPTSDPKIAKKVSGSLKKYFVDNPDARIGANNPFFGKKHTEEFKRQQHERRKGIFPVNEEQYKRFLANLRRGEDHPNWAGGSSKNEYPAEFNKALKAFIKERHSERCFNCGEEGLRFCVHHINYQKSDCRPSNLCLLCDYCHGATNAHREQWEYDLTEKMKELKWAFQSG